MSRSGLVAASARFGFRCVAACTHVAHRVWVYIRDVQQYGFVAILRYCIIPEALPLGHKVHPSSLSALKGTRFPLGGESTYCTPKWAEQRFYQRLCNRLISAPDGWHNRACRMRAPVAPRQSHLVTRNPPSSNSAAPRKRTSMPR